jgi:hypothetical protein
VPAVGGEHLVDQHGDRGAVADDVVQPDDEQVLLGGQSHECGPQQRWPGEVERPGQHVGGDGDGPPVRIVGRADVDQVEPGGDGPHLLARPATDVDDRRAQGLVPGDHEVDGVGERRAVQPAGQPERRAVHVRGTAVAGPVQEPQPLLRRGERNRPRRVAARDLDVHRAARRIAYPAAAAIPASPATAAAASARSCRRACRTASP